MKGRRRGSRSGGLFIPGPSGEGRVARSGWAKPKGATHRQRFYRSNFHQRDKEPPEFGLTSIFVYYASIPVNPTLLLRAPHVEHERVQLHDPR
jgi:hypothetical protein